MHLLTGYMPLPEDVNEGIEWLESECVDLDSQMDE